MISNVVPNKSVISIISSG